VRPWPRWATVRPAARFCYLAGDFDGRSAATVGVLLLFFDGVGVGSDDPDGNPFAAVGARRMGPVAGRPAADGLRFRPIDATLGVEGLPQSATGQTTLLTGVNAAQRLGHHQVGIPGPSLWPLLERESLFRKLVERGARPTFANAFTRPHLEARRPRWSASTRAFRASGLPFRMLEDEGRNGGALSHDYTGEFMRRRGFDAPARTAGQAAEVLVGLTDAHDFVFYEYFLTDLVAHRGTAEQRVEQASRVEALVDAVLERLDTGRHHLMVTSDHGNLEESWHPRHTRNPVPLLAAGPRAERLVGRVERLTDVAPAILDTIDAEAGGRR
jgi:hypothetical protein